MAGNVLAESGLANSSEAGWHLKQSCDTGSFHRSGTLTSVVALVQDRVPFFDMTAEYSRVGEHPRPVLLVWGINDQVNPTAVASTVGSDTSCPLAMIMACR